MKIRYVISSRPDIPEDWIICNAPRPIHGTKTWTGPFITGVLYAGIAPDEPRADEMIAYNSIQDAVQVLYISEEKAIEIAAVYYQNNYPETFDEVKEMRSFLLSRGLEILNGGTR
ncbi:MAG: hypothetical protein ACYSW6_11235 [Planctomycetota bacterium]|jgi:hypothetical protein